MANIPVSAVEAGAERASEPAERVPPAAELNLLFPWPEDHYSPVWRWSIVSSVALHVLLFSAGVQLKSLIHTRHPVLVHRNVTHLYLPPDLMTQKDRNKGELSKSFDLASLLSSQRAQRRVVAPAPGSVRRLELPKQREKTPVKQVAPQITAEPPKETASNQPPPAGIPDAVVAPAPAPAPVENATPAIGSPESQQQGAHKIVPPKNSLQDVLQQMASGKSNSSSVVISDQGAPNSLPAAPGQQALQGHMNSAIELKTDPQGADFRPYLKEILAIVRRNWFSVLPSSARIGVLRGSTTIQFVVNKDGSIPKLIISDSSGAQPLDRAAVAGLSMSNPLPPLPADFKGGLIRLQFSFNYNMPSQ